MVVEIQREGLFSDNEEIKELETDHLRLLLVPYYEADVLYRVMANRRDKVKLSQTFYLEYLKLMSHYGMLDKDQKAKWKLLAKEAYAEAEGDDGTGTQLSKPGQTYGPINFDHFMNRNEKIAMARRKKDIENQLDLLKNYSDDETKRKYYMQMLHHSIVRSFEQLSLIFQEMKLLEHQQTLPRDEKNMPYQDNSDYKPKSLKVVQIPKRDDAPYLLTPQQKAELYAQQIQNQDGSVTFDPTNPDAF